MINDVREKELREMDDVTDVATVMTEVEAKIQPKHRPDSGKTFVVPRLMDDLRALKKLTESDKPSMRVVRSKKLITALYGFGDASSGGFGSSIEHRGGIAARFGLWGRDTEDASSNYRELRNLVEAVEEEADAGHLTDAELWLFTDNSTAESCFAKGSSSSKLLHALVLRLRKIEMDTGVQFARDTRRRDPHDSSRNGRSLARHTHGGGDDRNGHAFFRGHFKRSI